MSRVPLSCSVILTCLIIFILTLVPITRGADPTYSPQTINDTSGNSADDSSTITWGSLPAGDAFKASNPSRVSEGLKAYYDLMHSFINSVFMKGIPDDLIEKGIQSDFDAIISNYQSYISYFIGFGICVGIGVLFLFIFPIIACCFCCCRCCCGNCGGKKVQLQESADNVCRKYTFVGILFVSTVFVMVGSICIYVNNENMTTTLNNIPDTAEDNLNDVRTFVNNTVNEAKHIVTNNFAFVQSALYRDLDNIAFLVGLPLKTDIEDNTNISSVLTSAYSLADSLDTADAALSAIEANKTAIETSITDLQTALTAVTTDLDTIFTNCGTTACPSGSRPDYTGATPDIDTSSFPDLTSARANMDDAKNTNLTAEIVKAEGELDDIPDRVERDSNSTRIDLKTTISDLSDNLQDIVDQISDVNNRISGENATIDLDKFILDIKDYKEMLEQYDKYRWYGGVGLASIGLLVVVFASFGILFGIFGTSTKTLPEQRSSVSNCGGIMLMVSGSLILVFSALLMLLTVFTFLPGAPIHKVFCEPLTDLEELERYLTIYNDQQVGAGKYFLADMVLGNDTIPLTVTGALQNCKAGQGAFTAFKLDNKFDLTDMLNYSKTLNVQDEVDNINVDLSTVDIYPTDLKTQLSDLKDAVNISFGDFYTELGSNVTSANLSALADEIDSYAVSGIPDPYKNDLQAQATELRRIEAEEYAYVESNKTALNTSVADMDAAVSNIPTLVDSLDSGLQITDDYIKNNASTALKSILNTYVNRLLTIIDAYVNFTDDAVKNKLGSCEPVWNIYNSLLVYTFCYNFMDCFNGFWFSLGWVIFFFIPSLIFSVKLAKYFRRMNYPDDGNLSPPPYPTDGEKAGQEPGFRQPDMPSKAQFWMRNNKIAHRDSVDDCSSSPAPPFPSKDSRDYLHQVPPNLYEDNSLTNNAETSSASQHTMVPTNSSNCPSPTAPSIENANSNDVVHENEQLVATSSNSNQESNKPEDLELKIFDDTRNDTHTDYDKNSMLANFEQDDAAQSPMEVENQTLPSLIEDIQKLLQTIPLFEQEVEEECRTMSPTISTQENEHGNAKANDKVSQGALLEENVNAVSHDTEKPDDLPLGSYQSTDVDTKEIEPKPEVTVHAVSPVLNPQNVDNVEEIVQVSRQTSSVRSREDASLTPVGS